MRRLVRPLNLFDLKVDSGFPDRFFREALKEPKGESKRGAKRGSYKGLLSVLLYFQ